MVNRRSGLTKAKIKNRRRPSYEKEAMLNLRSLDVFRNLLREILAESTMDEDFRNALIANIITKGSRTSLEDTKDYVRGLVKQGVLGENTSNNICQLLDRNRKYR